MASRRSVNTSRCCKSLQNANVVVYGYTDNLPIGPALQRGGIANDIDLSSRCAGSVVAYLGSPGVKPDLISAGRLGDTRPVASNDTPDRRGKNTCIDVSEGPRA
jgi:chemotaxis protein MotB